MQRWLPLLRVIMSRCRGPNSEFNITITLLLLLLPPSVKDVDDSTDDGPKGRQGVAASTAPCPLSLCRDSHMSVPSAAATSRTRKRAASTRRATRPAATSRTRSRAAAAATSRTRKRARRQAARQNPRRQAARGAQRRRAAPQAALRRQL